MNLFHYLYTNITIGITYLLSSRTKKTKKTNKKKVYEYISPFMELIHIFYIFFIVHNCKFPPVKFRLSLAYVHNYIKKFRKAVYILIKLWAFISPVI